MAGTKGVNVIAPTWFMLTDNDGNYECLADRGYVDKAHDMGMQVWAVLDNFTREKTFSLRSCFRGPVCAKN